jgi:hypothetical protein
MADSKDFRNKNTEFTGSKGITLPKGTTAERVGTEQGVLRYNEDLGFLEQYNSTGWAGIDAPPTITNITGTISSNVDSTITVTGSNFKSGSTITVEGAGVNNTARAVATTFVNASELTFATAASSVNYVGGASFAVRVTNPSGLAYLLDPAGTIDQAVAWNTAAGSLGTLFDSQRGNTITVNATDPDGTSVTYAVTSGSLPAGASLNSANGQITGFSAVGSDATSNFTITATSNGIGVPRAFSITIKAGINGTATGGGTTTQSGTTTTHVFTSGGSLNITQAPAGSTMEVLVVGGGGGGGGSYATNCSNGGGGAGGLLYQASRTVNTGTFTVNVGSGGSAVSSTSQGGDGGSSQFDTIVAIGGGGGGGGASNNQGRSGGSGGGGGHPGSGNAGSATQGNSGGATGYGFGGGLPSNANPTWGGGGGGGAGGGGGNGTATVGANGGNGRQYSQFTTAGVNLGEGGWFAGGGGGAACDNGFTAGLGGTGGAGDGGGGTNTQTNGDPGINGTGGGGGGGGNDYPSGRGGNGIVIVRYTT